MIYDIYYNESVVLIDIRVNLTIFLCYVPTLLHHRINRENLTKDRWTGWSLPTKEAVRNKTAIVHAWRHRGWPRRLRDGHSEHQSLFSRAAGHGGQLLFSLNWLWEWKQLSECCCCQCGLVWFKSFCLFSRLAAPSHICAPWKNYSWRHF